MNNNKTSLYYEIESKDKTDSLLIELCLFAAAAFLLTWGLGTRNLWSSEGCWAEITREMFLSRDFFHPTIVGESYFDKPLLTYWVFAALTAVTGRLDEFIIRLQSVISALIAITVGKIAADVLSITYCLHLESSEIVAREISERECFVCYQLN